MFKDIIVTKNRAIIDLEYDKDKYDFEYVKSKGVIILRRKSDNQVLEIFSDKIEYIVQSNTGNVTNFIVTDYSEVDKDGSRIFKIKHYVDTGSDELSLRRQFDYDGSTLDQCRITESSFIVDQKGCGGSIYNLENKSKNFDYIYNNKKISEIIGENILMVSEIKRSFFGELTDRLTYGIDPSTFEIVTPIWSELQQRYIAMYTDKQVDELQEKYPFGNIKKNSLEDNTIYFEVERYLRLLTEVYLKEQITGRIYLNFNDSEVNEDFVKEFVKK